MQAVTVFRDETNNHRLIQIDLDELDSNDELLEDILDIITIEMRKNEETISWEEAKEILKSDSKDYK